MRQTLCSHWLMQLIQEGKTSSSGLATKKRHAEDLWTSLNTELHPKNISLHQLWTKTQDGWWTWISYSHQHLFIFTILFRWDVFNHLPLRMLTRGRHRPASASNTRCVLCHEEDMLETDRLEMLPRRKRADDGCPSGTRSRKWNWKFLQKNLF